MPRFRPISPRARIRAGALGGAAAAATVASSLVLVSSADAAVTHGDFNGDGRADLAVGAPADSVDGQQAAGAVNVLYGTANGVRAAGDQQFTRSPQSIGGVPYAGGRFGAALAAGDFDADGFADLAIGSPGDDVGGLDAAPRSGSVTVLYGSSGGLGPRDAASTWSQNSIGLGGSADTGDQLGAALAAGDLDGDGHADLAIGAPGDSVDGQANAGAVTVLYGRDGGLVADGSQLWTQNSAGIKGVAGAEHRFGSSLAAGDVSADPRADLAIGIPGGVIGGDPGAGAVGVLYGKSGGLSRADELWSQDARGVKGGAEESDAFGAAVAIGDFDGDGIGDLAAGAPRDSKGNAAGAGVVNVLYGSSRGGVTAAGDQLWSQRTPGVKGRASVGETFGSALAAGDVSRDGADDLAIGTPGEAVGGAVNAGAVTLLYARKGRGLTAADASLNQRGGAIKGGPERGDRFGGSVGAGDFDGDGVLDLTIGAYDEGLAGFDRAGAVHVLYGSGNGIRRAGDQLLSQATTGVDGAVGDDRFGFAVASGAPAG